MRALPSPFLVSARGKWTSAGGVVFDDKGCVALVRQIDRSNRARWTLPKGRIDLGESIERAALREVDEEAGLRARITGYLGRHEGERHFTHYFSMKLIADHGRFDDETLAVRFVKPARARKLLRSSRDRGVLDWAMQPTSSERFMPGALAARPSAIRLRETRVA